MPLICSFQEVSVIFPNIYSQLPVSRTQKETVSSETVSFLKRELLKYRYRPISPLKIGLAQFLIISLLKAIQRVNPACVISVPFDKPDFISSKETLIHDRILMCREHQLHPGISMNLVEHFQKLFCQPRMQASIKLIHNKYCIRPICQKHIYQIEQSLGAIRLLRKLLYYGTFRIAANELSYLEIFFPNKRAHLPLLPILKGIYENETLPHNSSKYHTLFP